MWWIALATIAAAPVDVPHRPPLFVRQAQATVRIVTPARIRLGEEGTDRYDLKVRATKTRFRDADGSFWPARLVEFP
jgi:hypothetical protein